MNSYTFTFIQNNPALNASTHCGLVTPYGEGVSEWFSLTDFLRTAMVKGILVNIGSAITWTNINLPLSL